jgi:hypothetical protein
VDLLKQGTVQDMLTKIWGLRSDIKQKIILLMWCWWSVRNKTTIGEQRKSAQEVVNEVNYHMMVWNLTHQQPNTRMKQVVKQRWKVPPEDAYKINCDGTFLSSTGQGGWGFVIRDHAGQVVMAGAGAADPLMNAYHAETLAMHKGPRASFCVRIGTHHPRN